MRLIPVLEKFGIIREDIERLRETDFNQIIAFHMDAPPQRVDFLTAAVGLQYDKAKAKSDHFSLEKYRIPILRLEDLIVNKLISGRPKDKADVEELQKIMRLKKK